MIEGDDAVLAILSRIDSLCKAYTKPASSTPTTDMVATLSKENADLRKALHAATAELSQSRHEKARSSSSSTQSILHLESRLTEYETKIKALEDENFAAVQAKGQLEIRLARLDVNTSSALRSKDESEAKQAELRDAAGKLKSELAAALQGHLGTTQALREATEELAATKSVLEQMQRTADVTLSKLERAQEEYAVASTRLRGLESEVAAAQAELKTAHLESARTQKQLESDLRDAQQGIVASQGDAASTILQARQAQQAADSKTRDMEAQLREAQADGKSVQESLARATAELESKASAMGILTMRLQTAEALARDVAAAHERQIAALKEEVAAAMRQAGSVDGAHKEALVARDAAHAVEKKRLEALLGKANEDTLAAVNREEEAAARIAALTGERDTLASTLAELRDLMTETFSAGPSHQRDSPPQRHLQPPPSPVSSLGSPSPAFLHPPTPTLSSSSASRAPSNELVLGDAARPVVLFEMGQWHTRIGVYNHTSQRFELRFSCPTYTASPLAGKTPDAIVKSAGFLAGPAYAYFREIGLFVGEDARYMCYDHPDGGLRSSLQLDAPPLQGGRIINAERFAHIVEHCFQRLCADASINDGAAQIIFAYKLSFTMADFAIIGETLFDRMACSQVCLLNEPALKLACQANKSCVLVDMGASQTTVYPSYERIILNNAVAGTPLGGEHVTVLLEKLLSRQLEQHSSQLPRRRQDLARGMKEQHAFVAESFEEAVQAYGSFAFDRVKVMNSAVDAAPSAVGRADAATGAGARADADIAIKADLATPDGTTVCIQLARERFYCTEVLFQPSMLEGVCGGAAVNGLVETILQAVRGVDESVRDEVCSTIVLAGRTALLPGMCDRLYRDLKDSLAALGVSSPLQVVLAERSDGVSSSWDGAEERVRRAHEGKERIEEQNFVSGDAYAVSGQDVFNVVAFSFYTSRERSHVESIVDMFRFCAIW